MGCGCGKTGTKSSKTSGKIKINKSKELPKAAIKVNGKIYMPKNTQ